jgi:hypothetical protein
MPSWTCTICGQVVELRDDGRPRWPVKAYENCKLQHHYVGNVCIAYAHPELAKELIMMALSGVRDRPLANMGPEPRNHSAICDVKVRDKNLPDAATTAGAPRPFPNPLI